jgi:hypothetical protein
MLTNWQDDAALLPGPDAQVHDTATQVPRRNCGGVLTLLRRGPCAAEQVHSRFRIDAPFKLYGFNHSVPQVLYTAAQES